MRGKSILASMRSLPRFAPIPLAAALVAVVASGVQVRPDWGRSALSHVEHLSEVGPRVAGSSGEQDAAAYIESEFRQAGYQPVAQTFSLGRRGSDRESANIIAEKPGGSSRTIVVGAHYDSESRGRGADDNASGVGVLLEVARALQDITPPYTIRFVAFGAEEGGLRGSRYYVSTMDPGEIVNTVAMINVDSVTAGDIAYVYGTAGEGGRIRNWVLDRAVREGLDLVTQDVGNPEYPPGTTCNCSDHAPFEAAGIQYAYFESTNWALGDRDGYTQVDPAFGENGKIWHTPFDTLDYLESTFPGRIEARLALVTEMLYGILTEYQEAEE